MGLFALKLCNPRQRSSRLCTIIRTIFRRRPQILPYLLGGCYKHLSHHLLNIALKRIEQATQSTFGQKENKGINFKILALPFTDVRKALVDVVKPHIEKAINSDSAIIIRGMNEGFLSIKRHLGNASFWRRRADCELLPCNCKKMHKLFGTRPLTPGSHLCVRLKATIYNWKFLSNCSMDTIILPS